MMAGLPVMFPPIRQTNRFVSLLLFVLFSFPAASMGQEQVPIRSPEQIEGVVRVDAEELIDLVNRLPPLVLIDSRLATNRTFGYIEGSISLPDSRTDCESLARLSSDLKRPLLFYCNGPKCGRSALAAETALQCGHQEIYWFRGGIEEWRDKGYPLLR